MMSLKAFVSPAPARNSDYSVSKLIKVVNDDYMENVVVWALLKIKGGGGLARTSY